ncbi:hypothetical protein BDN72DRAFT_264746 [Pluteus cervinus]|uniref:Uncharacterized protein n=1 Tax=Pluteus cervinus TaxID=181527 RepID=A0ACD3AFS7_9AGAR|nr:hypothetical protein BDN72DRAFT_264746 [Pluteus cervinus]
MYPCLELLIPFTIVSLVSTAQRRRLPSEIPMLLLAILTFPLAVICQERVIIGKAPCFLNGELHPPPDGLPTPYYDDSECEPFQYSEIQYAYEGAVVHEKAGADYLPLPTISYDITPTTPTVYATTFSAQPLQPLRDEARVSAEISVAKPPDLSPELYLPKPSAFREGYYVQISSELPLPGPPDSECGDNLSPCAYHRAASNARSAAASKGTTGAGTIVQKMSGGTGASRMPTIPTASGTRDDHEDEQTAGCTGAMGDVITVTTTLIVTSTVFPIMPCTR